MPNTNKIKFFITLFVFTCITTGWYSCDSPNELSILKGGFMNPPDSVRPGVYWYFMDGNLSKKGMTKDLESMKEQGIGQVMFLEVNLGIPRGKVDFLSEEWKDCFKHAVAEAKRLGIEITLGVGPGWTGSGGPWVRGEESMQHLVASSITVSKPGKQIITLPKPEPRKPFFGIQTLTDDGLKEWTSYYEDVVVLAFPTPNEINQITDIDEKALYYRSPYSSVSGVKQFLPTQSEYPQLAQRAVIDPNEIIDLTANLKDSLLIWDVPKGEWTIMRFGSRNNGAVTRPAPFPGVGFEANKFDTTAINAHPDIFIGELFRYIGFDKDKNLKTPGGLRMLHMDSWEMGAQNWTKNFCDEFKKRRGYDPQPFYPVYKGFVVGSLEKSERFLWDLRLTSQELVLENHAGHLKRYAHRYNLGLSIEPYDMNPTADLELGAIADVPMCEYWVENYGFNTAFSAVEGSSLSHLKGQSLVPSEAFTSYLDAYIPHPGSIKDQGDWAFASGITRLTYHTFQHQSLPDEFLPGMTMGPHGVHWDRNQTWWHMAGEYHKYVSRCQFMLRQGRTISDILYLAPEGAPHVFLAPESAMEYEPLDSNATNIFPVASKTFKPDKKGYSFDACPPSFLYQAEVKDNDVVFPSGASYRILVLPVFETMTPGLLTKIKGLLEQGATIVGLPPKKSPSLVNFPACDDEVRKLVEEIWGGYDIPASITTRSLGKGTLYWGKDMQDKVDNLYPHYDITSTILSDLGLPMDFTSSGSLRYTHRSAQDYDIYFVSNRANETITADCKFRITGKYPQLWDPLTGKTKDIFEYVSEDKQMVMKLQFAPHQSYFVVFSDVLPTDIKTKNIPQENKIFQFDGAWSVNFDPKWGGPQKVTFNKLSDWSTNTDQGIKYYSGTAKYEKTFDLGSNSEKQLFLDLGKVSNMARVTLNGKKLGVVWTFPWRVNITDYVKEKDNKLEIEVVNLWVNRLIGDEFEEDDNYESLRHGEWPQWFVNGEERTSKRYTFSSFRFFTKDSPLQESGLIGPVSIFEVE